MPSSNGIRWSKNRVFTALFLVVAIFTGTSEANAQRRADLQRIFARPLIIGASVSGGLLTNGPGDRATELVMGTDTAVNIAENGKKARELVDVDAERLAPYSLVIGVDFLFWDSTLDDASASIAAMKNLIRSAYRAGRPVVIGDIPQLIAEQKPAICAQLNRALYQSCRLQRRCYVLPLDRLHRQAVGPGIVIGEYTYHYNDLTFDGLHLNAVGSDYLARAIIRILGR